MDNRPIGLLDSGVGGLTVVKKKLFKNYRMNRPYSLVTTHISRMVIKPTKRLLR